MYPVQPRPFQIGAAPSFVRQLLKDLVTLGYGPLLKVSA